MFAGLDFGTSNSSIAILSANGEPQLLPLEGDSPYLPSALYTRRPLLDIGEVDEQALARRVAQGLREQGAQLRHYEEAYQAAVARAKQLQQPLPRHLPPREQSEEALRQTLRGVMRREQAMAAQAQQQTVGLSEALSAGAEVYFGERAIREYLEEPGEGIFAKSPKSFLGAELSARYQRTFLDYITRLMSEIRRQAERGAGAPITQVVMGRPVHFHGTRGAEGDRQAIALLREAAYAAGFQAVEFELEPVAAALDYERTLTQDRTVLVVDVGGGTTDCTVMRIGPSQRQQLERRGDILATSGDRVGGVDLDIRLAFRAFMPHFGLGSQRIDGLPISNHYFWDAVAVNDLPLQSEFGSRETGRRLAQLIEQAERPEQLQRLLTVQRERLSHRLNRSAELAKIQLSHHASSWADLDYVEPALAIELDRDLLARAAEEFLQRMASLAEEAMTAAGERPSVVYVTGGTAQSPVVREFIERRFPDLELQVGNLFGSVTSGLATKAARLFG